MANVAVAAARGGAPVALAGSVGDDAWGAWLRERLGRERVDLSLFELVSDAQTQLALVAVDRHGEPHYSIYGNAPPTLARSLAERLDQAVADSAAVVISSNTLVADDERAITMRVREAALEQGRAIIFDVNLRLHRWRSRADAAADSNACVPQALLVRATAAEAAILTGEADPEAAAQSLVKAGARLVVLTLGRDGAILRGELRADAAGIPVRVVNTMGAGDVMTGMLLARLAQTGYYPPAVAAALPEAVAAAAQVCGRWGALD